MIVCAARMEALLDATVLRREEENDRRLAEQHDAETSLAAIELYQFHNEVAALNRESGPRGGAA